MTITRAFWFCLDAKTGGEKRMEILLNARDLSILNDWGFSA